MQVPHSEGLANHIVPESCVLDREVQNEALTGVRAGQALSRERIIVQGADAVFESESNMGRSDNASSGTALRGLRPWHARTLLEREPGDLLRDHPHYGVARIGKVRSRSR